MNNFPYKGRLLRVDVCDDVTWFAAKDVCDVLEIDTSQTRRLDDDEKGLRLIQTLGGEQEMVCVNEPGLYALILGSRKPEAKAFKHWIVHEVLPSIRKSGRYELREPASLEDLIILQAQSVKELKTKVAEIEERTEVAHHRIDTFDNVNIIGDQQQRLNGMIRKYAARNGLTYRQAWRDFRTSFNVAYRTNIVLLMENHKGKHGLGSLTMPEYLARVNQLEDALRVADKLLNQVSHVAG